MRRHRAEDEERRFTRLMVEVGPALLAYFERRVRAEGADLLAETMTVAWKRRADLPAEAEAARMWLFGVARNVLRNAHRTGVRQQHLADRLRTETRQAIAADPSEALAMRDLISRLDDDLSEVLTLVHWEGLSLVEIAGIVGIPASTARGRYQRAREQLLTQLTAADAESGPQRRERAARDEAPSARTRGSAVPSQPHDRGNRPPQQRVSALSEDTP